MALLNIPLPEAPPGGFFGGANAVNALNRSNLQNQILGVQAKYAPLTTKAEAASKLAYANLMGPQFLAKLLGHTDILANLTESQKQEALQKLYGAGGGGQNILNQNAGLNLGSDVNPLSSGLLGLLLNVFGNKSNQKIQSQPSMPPARPNVNYINQGNEPPSQDSNNLYAYDAQGNNIVATPEEIQAVIDRTKHGAQQQPQPQPTLPPTSPTFAENVGTYKGIVKEGEEAGKIRAEEVKNLSDTVFSGQTKQATLDNIGKIISSPEFEQIRQVPILGHHELSYYQKFGTPAQQNMVGQFMTLSGNIIRDASQDFKGAFRKGEQQLLENMKINPGDTVDTARGKMEQLSYLNKMITERARLTAELMSKYHISKLQAETIADKQINGEKIRSQIHNSLNPKPTEEDINFMARKYNTTPEEIKKRLKAKGII